MQNVKKLRNTCNFVKFVYSITVFVSSHSVKKVRKITDTKFINNVHLRMIRSKYTTPFSPSQKSNKTSQPPNALSRQLPPQLYPKRIYVSARHHRARARKPTSE